ncbi:MAG: hypothetical protein KIIPBIDF_01075 [Candidatus Methanoperedenaceae archaeon GB50]|nr:MAG: hypothetical protein KIIPBIDF_01075 [Candidatus Methanoperedenaceae archaeon GB50]
MVGKGKKRHAKVEEALCQGCGVCMAICEEHAINVAGFTYEQLSMQLRALLEDKIDDSEKAVKSG